MGLLTVIRKSRRKQKEVRILMLGLDNAGKTTIVKHYMHQDIYEVSPTLGFSINTIFSSGLNLNIWDIGGQKSLRPFWRNYFERTECLIWVVDMQSLSRLEECKDAFIEVLREDRLSGSTLIILLNKVDSVPLAERESTCEMVSQFLDPETIEHAAVSDYLVIPVSAYTGENLDSALQWITATLKKRLFALDSLQVQHTYRSNPDMYLNTDQPLVSSS